MIKVSTFLIIYTKNIVYDQSQYISYYCVLRILSMIKVSTFLIICTKNIVYDQSQYISYYLY